MEKLTCASCGSAYVTTEGMMLVCQSCDSRFTREQPKPADSSNAPNSARENTTVDGFFSFDFEEREVEKVFQKWLISDDLPPDDILLNAKITQVRPVLVPAHFFQAEYTANWKGSVGYNRIERFTDREGNSATRTVTDWSMQNGTVTGIGEAGRMANAETDNSGITIAKVSGWKPLADLTASDRSRLLPVDIDQARALSDSNATFKLQAEAEVIRNIQADRHRGLQIELSVNRYDAQLIYFPFYMVTYTYNGMNYTVALDGRNRGVGFAGGQRPKCADLKKAGNRYPKIAWIPAIPILAMLIVVGLLDIRMQPLADIIWREITWGAIYTLPVMLIVGFVARSRFRKNIQSYQLAMKQALNNESMDFDSIRTLERRRTKQRKGTKWVQLLLVLLTLGAMLGIAAYNAPPIVWELLFG